MHAWFFLLLFINRHSLPLLTLLLLRQIIIMSFVNYWSVLQTFYVVLRPYPLLHMYPHSALSSHNILYHQTMKSLQKTVSDGVKAEQNKVERETLLCNFRLMCQQVRVYFCAWARTFSDKRKWVFLPSGEQMSTLKFQDPDMLGLWISLQLNNV